jgi:glucan phosphorylase
MRNALAALQLEPALRDELATRGVSLADVLESEPDAALGNGGLGRLAACFLDSFAELGLPSFGYGLRYRYGMFAQGLQDGAQVERPDDWQRDGTHWDFERADVAFVVGFGGHVESDAPVPSTSWCRRMRTATSPRCASGRPAPSSRSTSPPSAAAITPLPAPRSWPPIR